MTIQNEERKVKFKGMEGIASHRDPHSGKYYVEFESHPKLDGWYDPNELVFEKKVEAE